MDGIVDHLADRRGVIVGGEEVRVLLYADDIVLLASSAEELRGMLARCQAFADESSFQFSLDKSQILVFGEPEPDEEFMIAHREMRHVNNYTYLGLVFHSSLGRVGGIGTRDKLRRFDGKKFFDGDTGETREIVDIFDSAEINHRSRLSQEKVSKYFGGQARILDPVIPRARGSLELYMTLFCT